MTVLVLANQVSGAAASQTAVESLDTPFLPGRAVEVEIHTTGSGTAPDYIVEGSNTSASSGFTTMLQSTALGAKFGNSIAYRWMRLRIATAAGTAGLVTAVIRQGV